MTPAVVLVHWRDSMTGVGGWHGIGESKQFAKDAWDKPLLAAGFLIEKTSRYLVIATGYNPVHEGEPEVNGTVMIPRSEVVSIETLRSEDA